jgi:hypothetical protein
MRSCANHYGKILGPCALENAEHLALHNHPLGDISKVINRSINTGPLKPEATSHRAP